MSGIYKQSRDDSRFFDDPLPATLPHKPALVSHRWERIRSLGCISSHTTAYANVNVNVNVNEDGTLFQMNQVGAGILPMGLP